MRRVDRSSGVGTTAGGPLVAGNLVLEPGRHEARVGERSLALTPTEFRLLEALVRAGGDIVPHLQLARAGWPAETDPDLLWLKPHLARLRGKVQEAGGPQVVAVRGVGYRIWSATSRRPRRPPQDQAQLGDAGRDAYVKPAVLTLVRRRRRSLGRGCRAQRRHSHATTAGITTTERVEVDVAVSRPGEAAAAGRTGDRSGTTVADSERAGLGFGGMEHQGPPGASTLCRGQGQPRTADPR